MEHDGLRNRLRADHIEIGRLAATARPGDPRLADAHDRVGEAERRVSEIDGQLAALDGDLLDGDLVDEVEVATALADFAAIWDCLASRE